MRAAATSALPIDLAGQLARIGCETIFGPLDDVSEIDALVCLLSDRIDASVIARAPRLRVVANCAVGYDNIDVDACTRAGIAVTNTPDVLTEATAELAFALALAAARRLGEGERLVRSGAWAGWGLDQLLGARLLGKTMGIVGFGRIGQALARRALGFGMEVVYADRHEVSAPARRVSLDALFAMSDVVSIHTALVPETRHLVDARRLSLMKPTAVLVNTARGGIVDEGALAAALESGALFAAALDVYEGEPRVDPRLLAAPRLVLAPHIGSATTEARTAMAQLCADAVIAVLSGHRPPNLVNKSWEPRA